MAAAKFLDTIARMPGMAGQAADVVKAYTQVPLNEVRKLLGLPQEQCPETWMSLPPRPPASLRKIRDLACPFERNLFGHPLAGLRWERHLEKGLLKLRWGKNIPVDLLFQFTHF